jgi:hypothetical protein
MAVGTRSEQNIIRTIARALKLTEEALGQVAQIAIEEIHTGLESSNHVEAAERDMRSALKQLVLAERELRSRHQARRGAAERAEGGEGTSTGPGPGPA